MKTRIIELKDKILAGESITAAEAYELTDITDADAETLLEAASEITTKFTSRQFDSCSIINARSGRCSEDCKWCAQSAHYSTNIKCHDLVSHDECMEAARRNRQLGIKRFSLVTSGRQLSDRSLTVACSYFSEMRNEGGLELCASMGLLNRRQLQELFDAGVTRYHCNLEAAPSFFPTLCTTHTVDDKIRTILTAKEIGFEVCSGGIIGMGESRRQRIELALELRKVDPQSIPINILCPIPGTPLQNAESLAEEEILIALALFRFVHPKPIIRFAGGRANMSKEAQTKALHIAMNGAIMGDMLTTIGSQVADDKEMVAKCGYEF